jgi:Protein of unknown function (DUF3489)
MPKTSKTTETKPATQTSASATEAIAPPPLAPQPESTADLPTPRAPRDGSKQAALIALLRSDSGATIAEIMAATGWLSHTVRGALAGALKKRGLIVSSDKVEGRGRVYRLPQD